MLALLTVTTNQDVVDVDDGVLSLREAIFVANTAEGPDEINFDFGHDGPETIVLTQGELVITDSLTIDGFDANLLTIDASGNDATPDEYNGDGSRLFDINDGVFNNLLDVSIRGVTLTGGDVGGHGNGGAIRSFEDLSIADSIITGNYANGGLATAGGGGGIYSARGKLTIETSTISNNSSDGHGGGIYTIGDVPLVIVDSSVSNNVAAGRGGGIRANGTIELVRSNISGNQTFASGGGIYAPGSAMSITDSTIANNRTTGPNARGGGLVGRIVSVVQSTISGNRTEGGISPGGGIVADRLTLNQSTVADNHAQATQHGGGGIDVRSQLTLIGSIVANNTADGANPDIEAGSILAASYSLVGDTTGLTPTQLNVLNIGVGNILNEDPHLGPLAYNGGPVFADGSRMLTHALLVGSPAIDAGDPMAVAGMSGVPEFDQRGEPYLRVLDGDEPDDIAIDIGAYEREFGETYTFVVDTDVDESDGDYSFGDFSLREAIELANGNPGADAIEFDSVLWADGPATILLTMGELQIADSLTVDGPGAELLTIDASGNDLTPDSTLDDGDDENDGDGSRVFNINNGVSSLVDVTIDGITLSGGDSSTSGGAIVSYERLIVVDSIISDNSTVGSEGNIAGGGAIRTYSSELILVRSTVSNNSTDEFGGAINSSGSLVHLDSSTISGNTAGEDGGGLLIFTGGLTIASTTISGNHAGGNGGGISVLENVSPLSVSFSTIVNNSVSGNLPSIPKSAGIHMHFVSPSVVILDHSILAKNLRADGIEADFDGDLAMHHSFLGVSTGATITDNGGNVVGHNGVPIDPKLGPLAYNGGSTWTHALLPGSSAIDAGDPAAVAGMNGVPEFDQRGMPWGRVANGDDVPEARIDMGAVEWQVNPLGGDYNFDGRVDAADYSVWRDTLGSTTDLRADGSSESTPGVPDGVVDAFDYAWWKGNFGNTLQLGSAAVGGGDELQAMDVKSTAEQVSSGTPIAGELRLTGGVAANTVTAAQPPADPEAGNPAGVASVFGLYSMGASAGGVDAGLLPVEPGADGRVRSITARNDAALLAWVARHVDGKRSGEEPAELSCDAPLQAEAESGALDDVFAALGALS